MLLGIENIMKIGIDVHGVITRNPKLFAEITAVLTLFNHQVHIITGVEDGDRIRKELAFMNISYTHFFSITSYHKSIGTHIVYKNGDPTQPMIAPAKWDRTKADYCKEKDLDIHIDDSEIYGNYFRDIKTQYLIYNEAVAQMLKIITWHHREE